MPWHGNLWNQEITGMIYPQSLDLLTRRHFADPTPSIRLQPMREVRNRSHHPNFIPWPLGQMQRPLANKNTVGQITGIWKKAGKGEYSQPAGPRCLSVALLRRSGREDSSTNLALRALPITLVPPICQCLQFKSFSML